MSNDDYLYHRRLFYVGYEVAQHFPEDVDVLFTTFEEGVLALSALQRLQQEDRDLAKKVYELSQQRKRMIKNVFYPFESTIPEF